MGNSGKGGRECESDKQLWSDVGPDREGRSWNGLEEYGKRLMTDDRTGHARCARRMGGHDSGRFRTMQDDGPTQTQAQARTSFRSHGTTSILCRAVCRQLAGKARA